MRAALALVVVGLFSASTVDAKPSRANKRKAKKISKQAIKRYKSGEYEAAGALFEKAYDLSEHPTQLRNAARAYEEGGALDKSLKLWQRFQVHPRISQDEKLEAEAHIELIQEKTENARKTDEALEKASRAQRDAKAAKEAADRAAQLAAESAAPAPAAPQPWGAIGVTAAGGVVAIAGIAMLIVSNGKISRLDDRLAMRDGQGRISGISSVDLMSEVDAINGQRLATRVLIGAGLSLAVAGAIWWMVEVFTGTGDDLPTATIRDL